MRTLFSVPIAFLALLMSEFSFSQGYQVNFQGQKQQGMGLAGTAILMDGASLFFNPGSVAFSNEFEIQIRPRSGLAAKNNISVLNTPGTIDSDYRGEIKVILYNHGKEDFLINNKDRIAQMVLTPVIKINFEETEELPETIRGEGGFGSTGK